MPLMVYLREPLIPATVRVRPAQLICAIATLCCATFAQTQSPIRNASGIRLLVADENVQPTVRIVLPGHPDTDGSIEVIFPEHVTARMHGSDEAAHLYLFRPGPQGERPAWRAAGQSLEYAKDFRGGVQMLARATLEEDGVRFHYEFVNRSAKDYDMIYAVTDPRLTGMFHDVRLERTYVHHKEGFDLLASETPSRLTVPLNQWLPSRYRRRSLGPSRRTESSIERTASRITTSRERSMSRWSPLFQQTESGSSPVSHEPPVTCGAIRNSRANMWIPRPHWLQVSEQFWK